MSRSSPPASNIADETRENNATPLAGERGPSLARALNLKLARLVRWLHIYMSMLGLAIVLFFSVTGLTLNHPGWFETGVERRRELEGDVDRRFLGSGESVSRLEIVEHLRRAHALRGALVEFRVDDAECVAAFKGPGYAADAFIDRATGHYTLAETAHGWVAIVNDLHKGRDAGPVWSAVIDGSAVLMTAISLSGLLLIFYLKLRRRPGLVVALVGTILAIGLYLLGVP